MSEQAAPRRGDALRAIMRQRDEAWKKIEKLDSMLDRAVGIMASLHRSIEPIEGDPDLAGRVPPAPMRAFVDALANIDRERCEVRRG